VFRTPVLTVEQASLETYVQSNNSWMFTHFCLVNSKTVLFTESVCALSFSTTSFPTLETRVQRHASLHASEMIKITQQTCLVHGFGHCDYTCWGTASVVWWLACWPLVPEFAGSIPTEAVGFFSDVKKSSACLPSEGK
jgi:hypothetical protein